MSARHGDPIRESFTLPLLFLAVAFAGGLRVAASGAGMSFLPPPLAALVVAVLLLGVMVRSGLLLPDLLVGCGRDALASLSGGVVLATLFAATAQVVQSLAPEAGLLHLLYYVFVTVLVWNTAAARPDRLRLLHSLFVILGSAFVLKYVLLEGLYAPQGGLMRRVLTALLEGVALGTLEYEPFAPITGYVAFFGALAYLLGLTLLPRPSVHAGALVPATRSAEAADDAEMVIAEEPSRRREG